MSIDFGFGHLYRSWLDVIESIETRGDALVSGVQDIDNESKGEYPFDRVSLLLKHMGFMPFEVDLDDYRANIKHDLNTPFSSELEEAFDLVFDIGTVEHVADTMQVFENYFKVVRVGGYVFILTPVCGYFDHGFHTFSPEFLVSLFTLNGFQIVEFKFCNPQGVLMSKADQERDVLIMIAARKEIKTCLPLFRPQQVRWEAKRLKQ